MEKIIEIIKKYKTQILAVIIILLLIPIIKITIDNLNKNYKIEKVSKEKYFELFSNNKAGIIDEKGEIVINPEYYEIHIPNPSKDIFVCYYDYNDETGKCKTKVINAQGTELFTKYNNIDTINLNGIETTMPYEKNLLKYKKSLEKSNSLLALDIEKYSHGARCTFPDFDCSSDCGFKEGKTLTRKI